MSDTRTFTFSVVAPGASRLKTAAATLGAGQSLKMLTYGPNGTTPLNASHLFGTWLNTGAPETSHFVQYLNSFVYDPTRDEITFVGSIVGQAYYHALVFNEATSSWSIRETWTHSGALPSGHSYDSITVDPSTGAVYFKLYGERKIKIGNGADWSQIIATDLPDTVITYGLAWHPTLGLTAHHGGRSYRWTGSAWVTLRSNSGGGTGYIAEYNATHNSVLAVGLNSTTNEAYRISASGTPSGPLTLTGLPSGINIGAGQGQNATVASSPNSAKYIVRYQRDGAPNWYEWDIATDTFSEIAKANSTPTIGASGYSPPVSGAPNIEDSWRAGHCVLSASDLGLGHGVILYFHKPYSDTAATGDVNVWLYRPE